MAESIVIDLDKLQEAVPEMTESLVGYIYDAAVYCLHHGSHLSGVGCEVRDYESKVMDATMVWTKQYSGRIERTYGETDYAVEFAGEAVACLMVRELTDYTVIERSQRHDGVDFWLAERRDEDKFRFHREARMESKGITEARYPSDIKTKVDGAITQTKRSDHTLLPAYIIVTEFSGPVILMVQR